MTARRIAAIVVAALLASGCATFKGARPGCGWRSGPPCCSCDVDAGRWPSCHDRTWQHETATETWQSGRDCEEGEGAKMTDHEKQGEIAARIARLSEIRAELVIARSRLDEGLRRLAQGAHEAGASSGELHWRRRPDSARLIRPWPSKDELDALSARIEQLSREAEGVLRELGGLGVDAGLFKLTE